MSYWNSASNRASAPNIYSRGSSVAEAREGNVTRLDFTRPGFTRKKCRVLLAHDLSGQSEIAFVRAARLTLEREGHLTILHVINSELPAPVIEAQRAHAKSYLETEVRRWLARRKLSYRIDIGVGDPAGAIAARAQAHDVNLVVTGRHRRRPFADTFIAATVERLLRQIQRPILVVSNSNQSPYRRVLIPIDFTDASAARIQFAASFLPQASLHLLHTYKRPFQDYVAPVSLTFSREERGKFSGLIGQQRKQALSRLIETLELGEHRPLVTTENGDALARVKEELARQKTDLLVVGPHARPGMEHAPIGRAAEAILRSSPCDILVLSIHGPGVARTAARWRVPSESAAPAHSSARGRNVQQAGTRVQFSGLGTTAQ
jgi:nucleotide-binding universal stress UspA family protein